MKEERDLKEIQHLAEKICEYMTNPELHKSAGVVWPGKADCHGSQWGMDMEHWDWNPGVGLAALSYYYETTKKQEILEYLLAWESRNRHKANQIQSVNATAPFMLYPFLYEYTRNKFYLDRAILHGEWLMKDTPRTDMGGIQHTVNSFSSIETLQGQLWADTIFMAVLFLARLARVTGNCRYSAEAVRQLDIHMEALQDRDTKLLYHGYNCIEKSHMSQALWGRGNAWLASGFPLIVRELSEMEEFPEVAVCRYRQMMQALVKCQDDCGLWHTVLDRNDFYYESSASSGIAGGIWMAVHQKLLDETYLPCAERAMEELKNWVTEAGQLERVSGGTPIMPTIQEYNQVSCYPTLYGQGLFLLLLTEVLLVR